MPRIIYIEPDGREVVVELSETSSVMQGAMDHDIEGIEAQCGGSCACATCHCYVETGGKLLPPPSDYEQGMLANVAAERLPNSRLSCQIKAIEGLQVRLPDKQS